MPISVLRSCCPWAAKVIRFSVIAAWITFGLHAVCTAQTISGMTLSPTSLVGGDSSKGSVTLSKPAGVGGVVVTLLSSDPSASTPGSVVVHAKSRSATFVVSTAPVGKTLTTKIKASAGASSSTAVLTIKQPKLVSLQIIPAATVGGTTTGGTVLLDGNAPTGGIVAYLTCPVSVWAGPSAIAIPAGTKSKVFICPWNVVSVRTVTTLKAKIPGSSAYSRVTVNPPALASLILNPAVDVEGDVSTATVNLTGPAPKNGMRILLTSNQKSVTVPSSVTIPYLTTSASFWISTGYVSKAVVATIKASLQSKSVIKTLAVKPIALTAFNLSVSSVVGGEKFTGFARIDGTAPPGGLVIAVSTSASIVTAPSYVTVPSGQSSIRFDLTAQPVATRTSCRVTATYAEASIDANVRVDPPYLVKVDLSSPTVVCGEHTTGTLYLNGPAPSAGFPIALSSDQTAAPIASSASVPAGWSMANFSITTNQVARQVVATIAATDPNGVVLTTSLTILPPHGLSASAWPKFQGGLANAGLGTGSGAAGIPKWLFHSIGPVSSSISFDASGIGYFGTENGYICAVSALGGLVWSFQSGGAVQSCPAISNGGNVYAGSGDGSLYALNIGGSLAWKVITGAAIVGSPCLGPDGSIYIGSMDGDLYAVSPSGHVLWTFKTGGPIESSPSIDSAGNIYVGSDDSHLYSVSFAGHLNWTLVTGGKVVSSPRIGASGVIYVGSEDGLLYRVNSNGTTGWTYNTGSFIDSTPAIAADGTVYVGSKDGSFRAISASGALKWAQGGTSPVQFSPAIGLDGEVYVEFGDNSLASLLPTGEIAWAIPLKSPFGGSPSPAPDGSIAFGSNDGNLYEVGSDGSPKWAMLLGGDFEYSPVLGADGTVYAVADDQCLYAINADGTQKWRFAADSNLATTPAIGYDGTIYVGSAEGVLYAVSPDGGVKWKSRIGMLENSSPTIVPDGTIYIGSLDHKLYAVNPDGTVKWTFETGGPILSSPAVDSAGTVYIGSDDCILYAITPDGYELWSYQTGSVVESSPVVDAAQNVYFGSYDGNLYSFNQGGTENWSFQTRNSVAGSPAIGTDGTVYACSEDGSVYALDPAIGQLKWSFATGGPIDSSVALGADGVVYVYSNAGVLFALGDGGGKKWSLNVPFHSKIHRPTWNSLCIGGDGTLYFAGAGLWAIR